MAFATCDTEFSYHLLTTCRYGQVAIPGLSTINVQVSTSAETNLPGAASAQNRNYGGGGSGAQFLSVARDHQFLNVDNMLQAVSIETLASSESDNQWSV